MIDFMSDIWAISTFYNPIRYANRGKNYKIFRENLIVPILTVELSVDGSYELEERDADILIKVKSESVLWHKERLLNIALSNLPKHVKYVAWLDCDIIFDSSDWPIKLKEKLYSSNLIQLFSHLYDLNPNQLPSDVISSNMPSGYGISYLNETNKVSKEDFLPSTTAGMRRGLFGLAWAAPKDVIAKYGFYDSMIVGSGDRALACAGYGRYNDAIEVAKMSQSRIDHYLKWGKKFFTLVNGEISYLDGKLYHLWHGDLSDRNYIERHQKFASFDFNPDIDLIINQDNCYEWKDKFSDMHEFLKSYLINRNEDGDRISKS